jgi:hypothetical protein
VKKTAAAPTPASSLDKWRSFRQKMEQLFDRFSGFASRLWDIIIQMAIANVGPE